MTPIEILQTPLALANDIETLELEERLYSKQKKILRGLPKDDNREKRLEETQKKIQEEIEKKKRKLENSLKSAEEIISALSDSRYRYVLKARHLFFVPMSQIAKELHYSKRNTQRVYKQALEKVGT
jgi:hypothetical protein